MNAGRRTNITVNGIANDTVCTLETASFPKTARFHPLNPMKPISTKGQKSSTNSFADRHRGGGGMMG